VRADKIPFDNKELSRLWAALDGLPQRHLDACAAVTGFAKVRGDVRQPGAFDALTGVIALDERLFMAPGAALEWWVARLVGEALHEKVGAAVGFVTAEAFGASYADAVRHRHTTLLAKVDTALGVTEGEE
jgi:hypothetical protein